MKWKEYESNVLKYFSKKYPHSKFSKNAKLPGRLSLIPREIDILIEGSIAGYPFRLAIECKRWKKRLDVQDVGTFLDKIKDVGIEKGVMISMKGYSNAAYQRAYNDTAIALQVLNFDKLPEKCDFWKIVFRPRLAIVIIAPNGWLVDDNVPEKMKRDVNCYIHPFELTVEEANRHKQNITFQIWPLLEKEEWVKSIKKNGYENIEDALTELGYNLDYELSRQDKVVMAKFPKAKIEYQNEKINIFSVTWRKIHYEELGYSEMTAGFEYSGFYFYGYSPYWIQHEHIIKFFIEFTIKSLRFYTIFNIDIDSEIERQKFAQLIMNGVGQPGIIVQPEWMFPEFH